MASIDSTVLEVLLNRLSKDQSDSVRAQCAESLRRVAPEKAEVRIRLEELLSSDSDLVLMPAAPKVLLISISVHMGTRHFWTEFCLP